MVTDVVTRQLQCCSTKYWIHIGAVFKQIDGPILEASRAPVLHRSSYDQLPGLVSGKYCMIPIAGRRAVVFEKRDDCARGLSHSPRPEMRNGCWAGCSQQAHGGIRLLEMGSGCLGK